MSEQILERSATSASGMPSPGADPASVAAPGNGRRRTLVVVLLAIVGGVVLGGLAFLMLGGSSQDEAALAPVPRGNPAAAAEGPAVEAAAPADAPAASTTRLTSRDPFAPLIPKKVAPAPAPAAPAAAAPADTASSSSAAAPVASTPTPAKGGTISALSISPLGNSATLKLDGKKYTVDEGETFATSYRLYDIFNQDCAGFLYGDRNAVVCKGDSVTIG
jgi:hypothetical protein